MASMGRRLPRSFFERDVVEVARDLLGRIVVARTDDGPVAVRLTEVEAYAGRDDPASHAFRGPTPRTAVMFGPPGHLYTYFVYGMHWCANIVTGPDTVASAVLLRSGDVVLGVPLARSRRRAVASDALLARGPAGLATVLGLRGAASGADLCAPPGAWSVLAGDRVPDDAVGCGPRVGVAEAAAAELRFWDARAASVSPYRQHVRRRPAVGSSRDQGGPRRGDPMAG